MHLGSLSIKGFKYFDTEFKINFAPGLTVLLGENGSGKSGVIDAIRLILGEDEFSRTGVSSTDFFKDVVNPASSLGADSINLKAEFHNVKEINQPIYLPWLDSKDVTKAILNLKVDNKEDQRGRYKRKIWGGESVNSVFEWDLLNRITCVYLPPLRDAEGQLKAFKGSRLSRLLKNYKKVDPNTNENELEQKFKIFNQQLLQDDSIKPANEHIKKYLKETLGSVFGQDTVLQFSEQSFERIVERLRLLFYPRINSAKDSEYFRELEENSLGYNNIIYLATVLAELEALDKSSNILRVLLIEEPEAHLHPQLQIRLLSYIRKLSHEEGFQVIVTSHSPTIAAAVSFETIHVFTPGIAYKNPKTCCLNNAGLNDKSVFFLERWLDITKSTLLFAKAVILVEGIAEAFVIPELAKTIINEKYSNIPVDDNPPKKLEDLGISIINMNGIYFNHFMQIFTGYKKVQGNIISTEYISVKCAGITDCDPDLASKPTIQNTCPCNNKQLDLIAELEQNSSNCRLFSNLKTFEYDLALEGNNLKVMCEVFRDSLETDGSLRIQAEDYISKDWNNEGIVNKSEAAFWLLSHISSKGEFAQNLAYKMKSESIQLQTPDYIKRAIQWVLPKEV